MFAQASRKQAVSKQQQATQPKTGFSASGSIPLKLVPEPRVRIMDDSLIVFAPARPFLEKVEITRRPLNAIGLNTAFSYNGLGFGFFYQREVVPSLAVGFDLLVSGRQNSEELTIADYRFNQYIVPNKLNRLFSVPMVLNAQYRFEPLEFAETIRPFVQAGLGGALVVAAPYIRDNRYFDVLESLPYSQTYVRPCGFVGVGIYFWAMGKTHAQVTMRYYVIPFGGDGLESMNNATTSIPPIRDFGGLFLALQIGLKF